MKIFMLDAACNTMPYDHSLCEALAKSGHNVYFFASTYVHTDWRQAQSYKHRRHFYNFTNLLYKNRPKGFLRRYFKTIEHIVNMFQFVRIVKSEKPDVIHFQWSQLPFIDRFYLNKLKKISPLIYTIHNTTPLHGEKPLFYFMQKTSSIFLSYFNYFIVHTSYSRKIAIKNYSINKNNINVVPHGQLNYYFENKIDSKKATLNKYNISNDEKVILFFGNISEYEGVDVLIKAYDMLSPSVVKNTRLLIVGRPSINVFSLQNLISSSKIKNNIIFDPRFVSEDEVSQIFNICTVIAMPYRHIDQSGVLMTVLTYGKPIVASNLGGFKEIIKDGKHGKLVEPGNPQDLADALKEVLKNRDLTNEMGKSVKKLSMNWPNWKEIANQTIEVYNLAKKDE